MEEIEVGDILHIQEDNRNTKIIITKEKIKGKIDAYNERKDILSIDNEEYKMVKDINPTIIIQNKKYFALNDFFKLNKLIDNEVEISLNINGDIQLIGIDKDVLMSIKAVVKEVDKDRDRLVVLTENNFKDYFYITNYTKLIVSDRYNRNDRYNVEKILSQIEEGDIIEILVDGRGDIEEIERFYAKDVVITYMDDYVVEIDRKDYDLADSVVLFEKIENEYYVEDIDDLIDNFYFNENFTINATIFESDKEIKAIVIEYINMDNKKELMRLFDVAIESINIAETYQQKTDILEVVLELSEELIEIEKNIDNFNNEEIRGKIRKLQELINTLDKKVLIEIIITLENKLELVEEPYNVEFYQEVTEYISSITVEEMDYYSDEIKVAKAILDIFDEKIYEGIEVVEDPVTEGDIFTWYYNSLDMTAIVTGFKEEYKSENPLAEDKGIVIIPEEIQDEDGETFVVNAIGRRAFNCYEQTGDVRNVMYGVMIPNTVKTIGEYSFENNLLNSITIPGSVKTIQEYAFNYNNISDITLEEGIEVIGKNAFEFNKIEELEIPNSMIIIDQFAFRCNYIKELYINIEKIERYSFTQNTGIEKVILGDNVKTVEYYAFAQAVDGVKELTIGSNVKELDVGAFSINRIESLVIPDSMETMRSQALYLGHNINEITIGDNVLIGSNLMNNYNKFKEAYDDVDNGGAGTYKKVDSDWVKL